MFFKKQQSVILNTQFTSVAGGTNRDIEFWKLVKLQTIWLTSSVTATGTFTISFRTWDTTSNPFVKTFPASSSLNQIVFQSAQFGVNSIYLEEPLLVDFIRITNTSAIAAGVFVSVIFEVIIP
jgi:hypothetical protein